MINRPIFAGGILALLLACGGGSGSTPSATPAAPPVDLQGPWSGKLTSNKGGAVTATALILPSGEMRYVASNGIQAVGTVSGSGSSFNGSGTMYAPTGTAFLVGGTTAAFTVSGTGTANGTMVGTYSGAGDTGILTFNYNTYAAYNAPVVMSNVAGNYTSVETSSGSTLSGVLTATGALTGNDPFGAFSGTLTVVDPGKNAFHALVTYTPSGQAPITYTGLAFFDFSMTPVHLYIQATGSVGQFAAQFERTGP